MDSLFSVRNNFYIGAYQKAVSEASQVRRPAAGARPSLLGAPNRTSPASPPPPQLTGLTEQQKIERDVYVYRSYIELGSYEVGGDLCGRAGGRAGGSSKLPRRRVAGGPPPHCRTHLCLLPRSSCCRRLARARRWRCKR